MVGWRVSLWVVIVLFTIYFLYLVRGILLPFILALIIAAFLDPTIKKLRLRGMSRGLAIGSVFGAFFTVVTAGAILLTPVISNQIANFKTKAEELTASMTTADRDSNFFVHWNPTIQAKHVEPGWLDQQISVAGPSLKRFGLPSTKKAIMEQYVEPRRADVSKAINSFFATFFGFVGGFASQFFGLLFTPIFVLFILNDIDRFKRRTASWIPPSIREQTLGLMEDVGDVFISYLRGVTIVVVWYIVVAGLLLAVLGVPYSILLAILFAVVYLVPMLGSVLNLAILAGVILRA